MSSPHKIERTAGVALIALYRAHVVEGMHSLGPDEIADRMGYRDVRQLPDTVLHHLVDRGWVVPNWSGLTLTASGREDAEAMLDK